MNIRRLNNEGVLRFEDLLKKYKSIKLIDKNELLAFCNDDLFSEEIEGSLDLKYPTSRNKFTIAKDISIALNLKTQTERYYDKGLWTCIFRILQKYQSK